MSAHYEETSTQNISHFSLSVEIDVNDCSLQEIELVKRSLEHMRLRVISLVHILIGGQEDDLRDRYAFGQPVIPAKQ